MPDKNSLTRTFHGCRVVSTPVDEPVLGADKVRIHDGWLHEVFFNAQGHHLDHAPDWQPLMEQPALTLGEAIGLCREFDRRSRAMHTESAADAAPQQE